MNEIKVSSEIGRLRKVLVHRPDGAIGRIIPEKMEDWLYDDIVYGAKMRWEYYHFLLILLYFLDKEVLQKELAKGDDNLITGFIELPFHKLYSDGKAELREKIYRFFHPNLSPKNGTSGFHNSEMVIDVASLLREVLKDEQQRNTIVTAVCTHERLSDFKREEFLEKDLFSLTKILISGEEQSNDKSNGQKINKSIFPPAPNLIFTRDIGVVVNEGILISQAAKPVRQRESLLIKYILKYHEMFKANKDNIIELAEEEMEFERNLFFTTETEEQKAKKGEPKLSVEGGDVMIINEHCLLIGTSERTNDFAVQRLATQIFRDRPNTKLKKIISVEIPKNRSSMHLDTIMTQVDTHDWIIYKPFIMDVETNIKIYDQHNYDNIIPERKRTITNVIQDVIYEGQDVNFIFCGGSNDRNFPYDRREQWTDGCNLLAVMPGVCIGYDRNTKTAKAFEAANYKVIHAREFLEKNLLRANETEVNTNKKLLILLPSGELSRARGGSHCMSMPLLRENL